jgi:tripartite-type tricarboxylate transporter receptor subunit TctC
MLKALVLAVATLAAAVFAPAASAQAYPNRPVKLLVGFPAGGSTDLAARILAARLSQSLGQAFVVENRPGASGNIAAQEVARAAPDGNTLLRAAPPSPPAPAFFDNLPWDPVKDFTSVSMVATVPILVVATPALKVGSIKELIEHTKAHPTKINLASPGATTLTRLSGEQFKKTANLDWVTVHYKGGAPAMQDLLAGNVHVMFANISDVIAQVNAGKLTPLAVTTASRSAVLPNVPTLAESGYPEASFSTWQGVVGPAGLPRDVVDRLNAEIRRIVAAPDVKAQFLTLGTDAVAGSPEEFGNLVRDEVAKIKRVAVAVGATNN